MDDPKGTIQGVVVAYYFKAYSIVTVESTEFIVRSKENTGEKYIAYNIANS